MNVVVPEIAREAPALTSRRITLADSERTMVHVARYPRATMRARVAVLDRPEPLATWCARTGVANAIVGGFFVRPEGTPLGVVRVGGELRPSEPFDRPWDALRSCVHLDDARVRLAPHWALGPEPAGDVLQAGPLLVRGGASRIDSTADPEGFSAGARQFDSDITVGRYPRAALGLCGGEFVAVACDGRAADDAGLALGELADLMISLGCEEAINLDGGGSTSLVVDGRLRNSPMEEYAIPLVSGRPVATAIAFEAA